MSAQPSPAVSVICIFLNAEAYIAEAVESVLAQTCQDFELLLVDDGSSDASTRIARDYAQRFPDRVRYLEHAGHVNKGMSATRNLGLENARGEFVAFIDSDDVWRPRKLEEQLAVMFAHPELGMVCGAANYWQSWCGKADRLVRAGHLHDQVVPPPEASLALYPLGKAPAPCPSDVLLRRSVLVGIGGFENHFTGHRMLYEDQGMLAKLYLAAPVWFDSRTWIDYRLHDDSCMSTVNRDGNYHAVRKYFLEWFDRYLRDRPVDPRVRRAAARALMPYRHPWLDALAGLPRRCVRTVRRAGAKVRGRLRSRPA
jgi:glycosyltransferase involved in cell wall biosynthesis